MDCLGGEILVQLLEEEARKLLSDLKITFSLSCMTGKCSKCKLRNVVRAHLNIRPLSLPLVCAHMHSFIHMLLK